MIYLITYLCFGLGFYTGLILKEPLGTRKLKKSDYMSIFRGVILGIFFWPFGIVVMIKLNKELKQEGNRT